MKQAELIEGMSALIQPAAGYRHQIKDDIDGALRAFASVTLQHLLDDGHALFPGIGKMVIVERASRKGRNPKTGEPIEIPAKRVVVLRIDKKVEALINGER